MDIEKGHSVAAYHTHPHRPRPLPQDFPTKTTICQQRRKISLHPAALVAILTMFLSWLTNVLFHRDILDISEEALLTRNGHSSNSTDVHKWLKSRGGVLELLVIYTSYLSYRKIFAPILNVPIPFQDRPNVSASHSLPGIYIKNNKKGWVG
jgi:hypothetical protein